jgi:hypothetical protein
MIALGVRQEVRTGDRQRYATKIAGLWRGLAEALDRLEHLAADPAERLADPDEADALPRLQYTLHAAGEIVAGIAPPADAEMTHAELAAALAGARDATAEVAEALAYGGPEAAEPLVYEWRGALFRVRLARLRLVPAPEEPVASEGQDGQATARAIALTLVGGIVVALGSLLGEWPLAAAGLTLLACALLRRWA